MATTNMSVVDKILKDYYLKGVQREVNDQTIIFNHFMQGKKQLWNGRRINKRYSIGDNNSFTFLAEAGNIPTPGTQTYLEMNVRAKYAYASFEVTEQAIYNASGENPGAFLNSMNDEMEGVKRSMKKGLDRAVLFGGRVKGYTVPYSADSVAVPGAAFDRTNLATFAAAIVMPFDGDLQYFVDHGVLAADVTTWVRVRLFDTEDWTELVLTPNAGADRAGIWVVDYSLVNNTISLRYGINNAAGTAQIPFAGVNNHYPLAVVIAETTVLDTSNLLIGQDLTADNVTDDGIVRAHGKEITGVWGNLGDPYHFDLSRNSYSMFRPVIRHNATRNAASVTRASITRSFIDEVWAEVMVLADMSDGDFDCIWENPWTMQKYKALGMDGSTPTTSFNTGLAEGTRKVDVGATAKTFMGKPIQLSPNFPRGALFLEKSATWQNLPQQDISFADRDGNILDRDPTKVDVWKGYARYWGQLACWSPRQNALIVGNSVV